MKKVIVLLFMFVTSLMSSYDLHAERGLSFYNLGPVGPDCDRYLVVAWWQDESGIKHYEGSAYLNIGLGCDPQTHGIFSNVTGSGIDFNNLESEHPDLYDLYLQWYSSIMGSNKQNHSSNTSVIYKNPEGKYVLYAQSNETLNQNELGLFGINGQHIGKARLTATGAKSHEYYCSKVDELKPGIYFAVVPISFEGEMKFETIKFIVN